MAQIDLQVVYSHAKGMVQLFIGDFSIGLPPALCEQLEKELAAAQIEPQSRLVGEQFDFCVAFLFQLEPD